MSAELIVTPSPSRTPILTTGEIIGIAVGGAVFVILVTTLLLIFSVWLVEIISIHLHAEVYEKVTYIGPVHQVMYNGCNIKTIFL